MRENIIHRQTKQSNVASYILMILILLFAMGLFNTAAYARSDKSAQMERMRLQFESAITAGDVSKAKQIWDSVDSQFTNRHEDKPTAHTVIFGGGAVFRSEEHTSELQSH